MHSFLTPTYVNDKTLPLLKFSHMSKLFWLILFAILSGGIMSIQSTINASLGQHLKTPFQAVLINFSVGLLVLILLVGVIMHKSLPAIKDVIEIPWYLFFGGMLGVIVVSSVVWLTPQIGITNYMAGALIGQLVVSAIIDHFGILNVPIHTISWQRAVGIIFLITGMYFIQK